MENILAETQTELINTTPSVVFDFDKTLINPDTTLGFFLFERFWLLQWMIFLHYGILAVGRRLGMCSTGQVKLRLLNIWCGRETEISLEIRGKKYAKTLKMNGMLQVLDSAVLSKQCKVWVVSASLDIWVKPLFNSLEVNVLASKIFKDGLGKWQFGLHCYGDEKASQLLALGIKQLSKVYTDGMGDSPMVAMSEEWHGVHRGQVVEVGKGLITFESWVLRNKRKR
jgi:phosphoserine phosphatase